MPIGPNIGEARYIGELMICASNTTLKKMMKNGTNPHNKAMVPYRILLGGIFSVSTASLRFVSDNFWDGSTDMLICYGGLSGDYATHSSRLFCLKSQSYDCGSAPFTSRQGREIVRSPA